MIWRERSLCADMSQPAIVATLIDEAKADGYEPMDFNNAGVPNVYLRAKISYDVDEDGQREPESGRWIEDGYVMFVRKKARS